MAGLALLDDFNRANENPIGGAWTGPVFTGGQQMKIVSNQLVIVSGNAGSYWSRWQFGIPVAIQATLATLGSGGYMSMNYSLQNPNSGSRTQYYLLVQASNLGIYKSVSGTDTEIGADFSRTHVNGDIYTVSYDGVTHTVYANAAPAFTRTDSSVLPTGYVGLGAGSLSTAIDDFYAQDQSFVPDFSLFPTPKQRPVPVEV